MSKSTAKSTPGKPAKPYDDFPLFAHATGRWAKKIHGRMEYFGSWEAGWQKALDNYQAWRDDLFAGRRPAKQGNGRLTIRDPCNAFREPGCEHLTFLTRCGTSWYKGKSCPLSQEFRKLMEDVRVYRTGRGFRALRHTFETIAGGSRDQVAVDHIMGHEARSMAATYREQIERERLQAVVDHVHNWLWPPEQIKIAKKSSRPEAAKR